MTLLEGRGAGPRVRRRSRGHARACRRVVIATAVLLATAASQACAATGIHKIRHVVIIMQENRSFDNYFGTFRGADGIPMRHGRPTVCMPAPALGHCVRPSHDPHDADHDLWHDAWSFRDDFDHGRMDGFARVASICPTQGGGPGCEPQIVKEAMGYHDQRELPNYWAYARRFVLQDHLFEPIASWSLPAHLWLVSEWSARCLRPTDPFSCKTEHHRAAEPAGLRSRAARRSQLRVDRPDVSAAPASRELGLLRHKGVRT